MRKKTPREARASALASGWTVEGDTPTLAQDEAAEVLAGQDPAGGAIAAAGDADLGSEPDESQLGAPGLSNAAIVLLGAFGGIYLLYAWGWFVIAQYFSAINALTAAGSGLVGGILQQIIFWAAPAAPIAWFVAAILMTRGRGSAKLALGLIVGALVLIPVPLLITGAAS